MSTFSSYMVTTLILPLISYICQQAFGFTENHNVAMLASN